MELRHLLVMKVNQNVLSMPPNLSIRVIGFYKSNTVKVLITASATLIEATATHENLIFSILIIAPIMALIIFMHHLYFKRFLKHSLSRSVFAVHNSEDQNYYHYINSNWNVITS